jgi:hypothetical protein
MKNIALLLLASSLLFACGGSDGTTPIPAVVEPSDEAPSDGQPTTSSPSNPSSPSTPATPSSCNSLTNDAEPLKSIAVVAIDAPAPTGGTIPSGTFHLAGITLYAGKSGKSTSIPITLQGTVKVAGDSVEQVLDGKRPDGTVVAERSTEKVTTSGSEVTFTKTCDGNGSRTGTFTATSSELTLFLVNDVGQTVAYKYR